MSLAAGSWSNLPPPVSRMGRAQLRRARLVTRLLSIASVGDRREWPTGCRIETMRGGTGRRVSSSVHVHPTSDARAFPPHASLAPPDLGGDVVAVNGIVVERVGDRRVGNRDAAVKRGAKRRAQLFSIDSGRDAQGAFDAAAVFVPSISYK